MDWKNPTRNDSFAERTDTFTQILTPVLYVLIQSDKSWRLTEKDWRLSYTRHASYNYFENKKSYNKADKNVLNVLLIWFDWFEKKEIFHPFVT